MRKGTYKTIDHPLASSDTQAHDLNDRGQIVAFYERAAGHTVLSPLTSQWTTSGVATFD